MKSRMRAAFSRYGRTLRVGFSSVLATRIRAVRQPLRAFLKKLTSHFKVRRLKNTRMRVAALSCAGIGLVLVAAVFADTETRLIHVFPTDVAEEGWQNETHALDQALSNNAVLSDFTRENSSFVIVTPEKSDEAQTPEKRDEAKGTPGNTETEPGDEPEDPVVVEPVLDTGVSTDNADDSVTYGDASAASTSADGGVDDVPDDGSTSGPDTPVESSGGHAAPSTMSHDGDVVGEPEYDISDEELPLSDTSPAAYLMGIIRGYVGRTVSAQEAAASSSGSSDVSLLDSPAPSEDKDSNESRITNHALGTSTDTNTPSDDTASSPSQSEDLLPPHSNSVISEDDSILPATDDVRVCTVLDITCRTIQFSGFDIGSVLADHSVEGYELRLSLGARTVGESFSPDKLFIRYYYRGAWHLAGEIAIDRELSNFDNGGHFAFPLPDLENWDALKDFKVELEYVRHDTVRTELFLDSIWVDATYEVDSADEPFPDIHNVLADLAVLEDSGRPDLLLADGERIELFEIDDLGEDIEIRSSASVYNGLTNARAYIAVTNRSEDEQSVTLKTHIGRQAQIDRIQERINNIPEKDDVSLYSEVAYYCDSTWEASQGDVEDFGSVEYAVGGGMSADAEEVVHVKHGVGTSTDGASGNDKESESAHNESGTTTSTASDDTASSSRREDFILPNSDSVISVSDGHRALDAESKNPDSYICKTTGEIQHCSSFNENRTNCIVGNERIDTSSSVRYESGWQDVDLTEVMGTSTKKKSLLARLFGGRDKPVAPHLEHIREVSDALTLQPRETRYFAIDVSFPVQKAGELVIEATNSDVTSTRSVWWRSAFRYRMPITVERPISESSEGVPILYTLDIQPDQREFFSKAAQDGGDIRFYDPGLRKELPTKLLSYSNVDTEARFGIDSAQLPRDATSTIFAYVGNEHVRGHERFRAPQAIPEPIEYFSVAKPERGAVLSIAGEREHVVATYVDWEESLQLLHGHYRDVLVGESSERVYANAPIRIALATSENHETKTLSLETPTDMQVTEVTRSDGRREYLLERFSLADFSNAAFGELEELPLPAVGVFESSLGLHDALLESYLRNLRVPGLHQFLESLRDFTMDEVPTFKLQYQAQKGKISRFVQGFFHERLASVAKVRLFHNGDVVEQARFEIEYGLEGEWTIRMVERPRELVPGMYTLEISIDELGSLFTDSFDFYWGVLAINMPQAIYQPADVVALQMAALDDKGDTICGADLRLIVTDPLGGTEELAVDPQGTCGPNNVTDEPDYRAWYRPHEVGRYTLSLTHVNQDGDVVHQVSDSFEVEAEARAFTIERSGATRIWPKAPYKMSLVLTTHTDFKGEFVEAVPKDFVFIDTGGADTRVWGGAKHLVWDVDMVAGETREFVYEYDAPDISPYLYLIGPAEVRSAGALPFVDGRQWQLASDALGTYVESFVTITPTTGSAWTSIDLSGSPYNIPANAILEISINNADAGNEYLGGVRSVTSSLNRYFDIHEAEPSGTDVTTMFVQASATSSIQYYAENTSNITFIILGYWTSGTYTERFDLFSPAVNSWTTDWNLNTYGVSDGNVAEIVMVNTSSNNEYIAGVRNLGSSLSREVTIHEAEQGGVDTATMLVTASTSNATVRYRLNHADIDFYVVGYFSTLPTGLEYTGTWSDLGGPTSNSSWTDRTLDTFGVPSSAIAEVVYANTADANSSASIGVRENGSSRSRVNNLHEAEAGGGNFGRAHVTAGSDASSTIEYFSSDVSSDSFRLAGYWSAGDLPPDAPTLYGVPFDNEKTGSSTPYFDFSALDPDGTSDIVYQIQWDDDADLDTSPLGDRTSDNESGCSPNCFQNTESGGDTSPFNEGERIRFSTSTTFTTGTTYYWRVRAKDVSGTNIYGEWSNVLSFTYVQDTDPKAWFQTEDAQFDTGTLSGTETNGSNAVQITATPATGAMVAYGEGTVTTPRYRIWDGSSWGSEGSAQDVGGQISWSIVRAAPLRDEYVLGTQDQSGDLNVQVYDGGAGTWGDLTELTPSMPSDERRGFDIAYQSVTGNAVVVFCDGDSDPSYTVWDGSSWSATSSVDLQFDANCNWIKLAASPTSDDIVVLAQADSSNTTADFEAQVYIDGAWGQSYTNGENTSGEEYMERMAISYEESGDEAVVVMGNGNNANFVGGVWNSPLETWTSFTSRTTQDDFEWGELTADVGTDNLGLCYIDEDNEIWKATWNGSTNAWDSYDSGDLVDTAGKGGSGPTSDYHDRPVTCKYEVTTGRDGYLMIPYSDTTNGRYRYWNGSTLSSETSVSTIEDSWTVGSTRTGDGKILTMWRDDSNGRYDFSYWNGNSWSARQTLETSVSDNTLSYAEPIGLAPKKYQPSSGTIVSPIIDFDSVPNQPSWGEILWNTTEPANTDVGFQIFYATTTDTCNVPIPDAALPGNSSGFTSTSSPLNISSLSTSTYNMLCISASLTSNTSQTPTLNDWTVSWQRDPFLTQTHFRWYANVSTSTTPTDPWPSGTNDVSEDQVLPESYAPSYGDVLRLRLAIEDTNVTLSASTTALKLQWAEGAVCSGALSWSDVGGISSSEPWQGYNNASLSDGATLSSLVLSTTDTLESYEEENPSIGNPNAIAVNDEGEWDFVLLHHATSSTNYCFRAIKSDGTTLNQYDTYPALVTNAPPSTPVHDTPFNNEAVASTTPWFTFSSDDTKSDSIHYQIQIDDDINFGSTLIDANSQDDFNDFDNTTTPSDKSPFNAGETVRYIPTTGLTSGTTYWWRVRARDPSGSNDWSSWSTPWSVTASSSVSVSTWHQTMYDQFNLITLDQTEATSTDTIVLTPPNTVGTATSPTIDFDWKTEGNAWGTLTFNDTESTGNLLYHIEYNNSGVWSFIPDTDLAGNAAGFDTTGVSLLGLNPTTYNQIRLVSVFTNGAVSPALYDWTVAWGYAVEQPTLITPFDNEKVSTTTPTFTFYSSDPQSDDLEYELQWSTTPDFAASSTRNSGSGAGFANTASSTDTSPFVSGNTISYTATSGDALSNGVTYWWRVRARDPAGANVWSVWSSPDSFTVDTTVTVSTWFQTTDEQFDTDTLNDTETSGSDTVQITTTVREALVAYAEGVVQTPRYRLWNGSTWSGEGSGINVSERMYWIRTDAAPTRYEYVMATMGVSGAVKAQVYTGSTTSWGNLTSLTNSASNIFYRGLDVAYEQSSGDAMVVSCYGSDALYRIWDGSSWSATSTINLSFAQNCEWVQLASDPASDEIILLARANVAEATTDYEMQVWNGSSWGNANRLGSSGGADYEAMAVEYEESGDEAMVVVGNGTANSFNSIRWNGSSWTGTTTTGIGNDLNKARLARDAGTDRLLLTYVDANTDLAYAEWSGSGWTTYSVYETNANTRINNVVSAEYETAAGRDGDVLFVYGDSNTSVEHYRTWDHSTLGGESDVDTMGEGPAVITTRTGDGTILVVNYNDDATEYDASTWDGSWSTIEVIESNSINNTSPRTEAISLSSRVYPSFTSGTLISSAIDFYDGSGPGWESFDWNDTTAGASDILYQVEYSSDSGDTWSLVPDGVLPGNSTGSSTGPVSLTALPYTTYSLIRLVGNFSCSGGDCPTLSDWSVTWSSGVTISGTAKLYDETTNATSGTVAIAVNGVLQSGKTGTISGGVWSIPSVTLFSGDVITVFIDGANDANEANAVTVYDGFGNVTGVELYERHLSIGSDDATTTTNAMIALYDFASSSDEDIFFDVDGNNDLTVCSPSSGYCFESELYVTSGGRYRPDSTGSGNIVTRHFENNGTTTADANTLYVSGSWDNNALFSGANSTVIYTATSTSEIVDESAAHSSSAFGTVTFGQSGTANWTLRGSVDIDSATTLAFGTLYMSTSSPTLAGALSLNSGTTLIKGSGTTTFDGTGTAIVTDSNTTKQDLGKVYVNGSSKTVRLGAPSKLTDLTVATANTFDVSASSHALEVTGDIRNSGSFSARSGTVTLTATTTGHELNPGGSSFYNLTASSSDGNGNWAFSSTNATIGNNFTVVAGILTLPTGTTTISGNIAHTGGSFVHNNGTVQVTGSGSKTIQQNNSPFFNLTVNGSGSWTITDVNATSSGSVRILNGTLTFPKGTYTIGKSLVNTGGTISHNTGTLRFTSATPESILANGSKLYHLTVSGSGGTFTMSDTNLTASGTVQFLAGTTTLPSGTLSVGGSYLTVGGTWDSNGGTVLFVATTTGFTVDPDTSTFNNVGFSNGAGGWTVVANATSTGSWSITSAAVFIAQSGIDIEVGGTFANTAPGATTWTGSTLKLNSGTSYSVGTSTQAAEVYNILELGANTHVRMWQSNASSYTIDPTASLYSQDHANVDGDLYVFGSYARTTGSDYWSYGVDFDGIGLLASTSRQVDVRFASGASAVFTDATLEIVGTTTASTTLANQGSGSYALSVTDGTVDAEYYSMTNTDADGFSILGSSTVSRIGHGEYVLTTEGGTMLTVSSTTIDANAAAQPLNNIFSTSTGITSGYNVTASGTASSYWWFKETGGNYDSEAYDNDPVADPGSIRFDDSPLTIDIDGVAYAGFAGGGASGACDDTNNRVHLVINGVSTDAVPCNSGTGAFTFSSVAFSGDVPILVYLDDAPGARGATISRTPQGNIANFDVYEDRVIVRHEDVAALTINQMIPYDSDIDTDIPFDAESGTLDVDPEFGLYIWPGKSFAPGGNVTLNSGGSGASYDGTLRLAPASAFTAAGTQTHSIGGGFIADSSATFTAANSTLNFTATTSGKTIAPSSSFYNASFIGSGGGWSIASSTTITNDLVVSAGTLSGTANLTVVNGDMTGSGTVALTAGTTTLQKTGDFGGAADWSFSNLRFGDGTSGVTTKTGIGNVSLTGLLFIASNHTLNAGSGTWTLTGAATVLTNNGTFSANTSTTTFAGTSNMNVPSLTYYNLVLAAAGAGSPTYTLASGSFNARTITVGDGVNGVTANANSSDPLITVTGTVRVNSAATYSASNLNDLRIAGSYENAGTFTSNGGGVVFNATTTGKTVDSGNSSFHHVSFNGSGGGWTIVDHATSTGNFSLTSGTAFTQTSGTTLEVQGVFSNGVGGGATTWVGSSLYLNSGTSYSMNTKSAGGDSYGTLHVGANTDVKMWNSTSTVYTVAASGSLYSQDHNAVDGDLYLWGDYVRSSGNEYWSYATDFDGTTLSGGSERQVDVYLAPNATTTLSGGTWSMAGSASASTTVQNQSTGTHALRITGGTFSAQYYQLRDMVAAGLEFSGSPTVSSLNNGDLLLEIDTGTMMTVPASVITANPAKNWTGIRFATSSGVATGTNVTTTGSTGSSWRFVPQLGNLYGESYDSDPAGDPGYLVWLDSAADVVISGNVYSDEVGTVSSVCNGSTLVVTMVIEGVETASSSCAVGTGYYEFTGVTYAPGDSILVYLNTDGGVQGANGTVDPVTSISDMHLYENRVVVRHEDTNPMTIATMATYDSSDDGDIPFTATTGSPDTLSLSANKKLIVWANKTFEPGGNVTLTAATTANDWDGTLELQSASTLTASSTLAETLTIGGNLTKASDATFTAGTSTLTFTSTAANKIVQLGTSAANNLVFNGIGGTWTFYDRDATTTNSVTISNGSVTFGTSTLAVGGSFVNNDTMAAASTSITFSSAIAATVTFGGDSVGSLYFTGAGAHTMTDSSATSTGSVDLSAGSVTLPSGTFAVSDSFTASSSSFTHTGTLRLYGPLAAQSLQFDGSMIQNLTIAGSGSWSFIDANATTTGTTTILSGGLTAPSSGFGIGSSFINSGTYNSNGGLMYFNATTTGKTIDVGGAVLADVVLSGSGGGWDVTTSATTTGAFRLLTGNAFLLASSTMLEVQGAFENLVGGAATNWTNSTLYLNASGTSYTVNTKSAGGDSYAFLTVGDNTDVRMWDSAGSTTTVATTTASLYSMDHNAASGDLYVWGEYIRTTGADYWSYAKDFDGTDLSGGSERQVDVRIASSSALTFAGGTLEIVGSSGATTTLAIQGVTGAYALSKTGGTLNAQYYQMRNLDSAGFTLQNAITITSLSYGDLELAADGGTLMTVSSSTIDQNPTKIITGMRFATSSGVATGTNVTLSGTTANYWDFQSHYGNYDGESYDSDGVDACGAIRWDDSTCLEVSQAHFRFRADNGGGGAPSSEWYDADWTKRKRINVTNSTAAALTNPAVAFDMGYDSDMQADWTDIRFTDDSGTTSLPYFVESYTTSATATIWVKVPSIPANGSTYIYAYYGNAVATNGESGTSTFTFFDDFEDDNITEYSGDTSYFDTEADSSAEGAYVLIAFAGLESNETPDGIYRTGTTFSQGSTVRWMQKVTAAQEDEPCTLFGVQSPGSNNQNYAVCLDQYPSDRLILTKNVSSNDGSSTTTPSGIASTSVTWATDWYTVEVDWLTNNSIYVSVYDSSGSLFATTSASDSSYTSGGMGFSFWGMHDKWDYYTVRPYVATMPTTWIGPEQVNSGASWKAAQDTSISQDQSQTFRVRFSIENTGSQITGQNWRLQYADKTGYGTCNAVPSVSFNDVPTAAGCGVNPICMTTTSQYADGDLTQELLTSTTFFPFTEGYLVESPSNQTPAMTLEQNETTEVEYAIELTSNATSNAYCMRVTDGGAELDSYQTIAEVTANYGPQITAWSLNSDQNIALVEGQSVAIVATGTITDLNGYSDILYATSSIFRSGVGAACTEDLNNCYQQTSLECPLSNCSGNSCDVTCTANIEFFAEPTDSGSIYEAQNWLAKIFTIDTSLNEASSTSSGVEMYTLFGVDHTTGLVDYGSLGVGQDSGATNATTTLQNTGNAAIDINLDGTDMSATGSDIPVGNQLFATSTFTYSSCVICTALSGTASTYELDLPKPTSTSTPITDNLYWGVYVPLNTAGLTHEGVTTFVAVGD